jgi:hypothetical protein
MIIDSHQHVFWHGHDAAGLVACGHEAVADAAASVLRAGGNAFDAGVAAVLAASVTEISQQVALVTASVREVVERSASTDAKVGNLSQAADRIGDDHSRDHSLSRLRPRKRDHQPEGQAR